MGNQAQNNNTRLRQPVQPVQAGYGAVPNTRTAPAPPVTVTANGGGFQPINPGPKKPPNRGGSEPRVNTIGGSYIGDLTRGSGGFTGGFNPPVNPTVNSQPNQRPGLRSMLRRG